MLPIGFTECPICHSKDTVARLACADESSIPKGSFVSLEHVITPIETPSKYLGYVKVIVCHYDVCANCGHRYCTLVEKTSLPASTVFAKGRML